MTPSIDDLVPKRPHKHKQLISDARKAKVLDQLANCLYIARNITLNQARIIELHEAVCSFSGAWNDSNGERSDAEVNRNVKAAFKRLEALLGIK